LDMSIDQPIHWTDHTCPKELEVIVEDTPVEIVRMVQQSLAKELYRSLPIAGEATAIQASNVLSIKPTQPLSDTRNSPNNQSASQTSRVSLSPSEGSRSPSKLSPGTKPSRSPLYWITAKAPKEMRGLKKLLKDR